MTLEKNLTKVKKSTTAAKKNDQGFTAEEKAAMKERAQELKAEAKANKSRAEGEKAVFEKIAEMAEPDRKLAKRVHEIVTTNAPDLIPRTWYGMPAYSKDDKVDLLLSRCAEIQNKIFNPWLQRFSKFR